MFKLICALLFPPKCIFCRRILREHEADLCQRCREQAPEFQKAKNKYSFIARWTVVWYYKGDARSAILRYKFRRQTSYAIPFGRFLAMKLQKQGFDDFDILTWVPVSRQRKNLRGYDQSKLLTYKVASELGVEPVKTLIKIRNNPPQSGIRGAAARRANVLNAYRVADPELIKGKRILLLDDVITTGATANECARTLITAGAKEVAFAALATASYEAMKK